MQWIRKVLNNKILKSVLAFLGTGLLFTSFNLILFYYRYVAQLDYQLIFNWRISPRPIFSFLLMTLLILLPFQIRNLTFRKAYIVILFPIMLLNILSLWYVLNFMSSYNVELVQIIQNTNGTELKEFIFGNLSLLLLLPVACYTYYKWGLAQIKKQPKQNRYALVILAFSLFVSFIGSTTNENSFYYEAKNRYFPFSLYGLTQDYQSANLERANYLKQAQGFLFHASKTATPETEIYVLFIGESARGDHFQLNNYPRETTPLLAQRVGVYNFSDAAAQASHTMRALPLMLTRATPDNYSISLQEKSIVSAFKEVGFKTFWISNQPGYVFFDEDNYNDDRHFECDISTSCEYLDCNDAILIDLFKEHLQTIKKGEKAFFVIQGYGSHTPYESRYPKSFNKFLNSDLNEAESTIARYDNSIFYTDYVIDQIINELETKKAKSYLLYTSDHGDNLGEDSRNLIGHSLLPTYLASKIPFFIWLSSSFEKSEPKKVEQLNSHKNAAISNDNVFQTLARLANISIPKLDTTKSLCDSAFIDNEQTIYIDNKSTTTLKQLKVNDLKFAE